MGANPAPSNVNNITAVLFLWTILPGYAAASYMPTIVLERPLFVRSACTFCLLTRCLHKPLLQSGRHGNLCNLLNLSVVPMSMRRLQNVELWRYECRAILSEALDATS